MHAAHESLAGIHPASTDEPPAVSGLARLLAVIVIIAVVVAFVVKIAIALWVVGPHEAPKRGNAPRTNARPVTRVAV